MSLLRLEQVSRSFDQGSDQPLTVLRDVDLSLGTGESVSIVGPSGSGKSTLLNIIGLLDRATTGRVAIQEQDTDAMDDAALARLRNEQIGFIFQLHHLLPQCTALENVLIPALAGRPRVPTETADRARGLLERVGLAERMDRYPGTLSGGERQRVAAVRALVNRPALLLADEPTGALDRPSAEAMIDLLMELNAQEQTALVLVTHADHLARRAQRVCTLRDGSLCESAGERVS